VASLSEGGRVYRQQGLTLILGSRKEKEGGGVSRIGSNRRGKKKKNTRIQGLLYCSVDIRKKKGKKKGKTLAWQAH